MNLHALQVFCEVAKYQSFSIAAKKLYISQPAVSQLVKKLEETYQVRLLEPIGHGVQLTDLGKTIYKQSQPIFEQEKVVESYLLFQSTVTKIVIGGTQLAIDYLLSKNFIQQTKQDFELKFNIKNTEELIESMQNKQIDFGLVPRKLSIDGYSCKEVYQDRWVFVASPNYQLPNTINLSEISQLPLLVREIGSSTRQELEQVFGTKRKIIKPIEVNSHSEALNLAIASQAIYFCPYSSIKHLIRDNTEHLKIIAIEDYQPTKRTMFLYENKKSLEFIKTRKIATILKSQLY